MPKPINKTWGHCPCRVSGCDQLADIRRAKSHERGAIYLVCPVHGVDKVHGAGPQSELDRWVDEHQEGPELEPEQGRGMPPELPEPIPEPKPAPRRAVMIPEPAPEPRRAGAGFFAWLRSVHRDFVEG